ncbi:MAG: hypothetical protein LBS36_06240 [Oscillospiraceae bacterium]|jgi:Zn finger protein HypA/HybF involved in hydrogenase expression|nr:hypothetical protein [Oscillospiraceae bacterium]
MNITEKAAYLKGLVEGLGLDPGAKESKIFHAILDLLDDLALTVSDLDDEVAMMTEQLDAVDEDLEELEEVFYEGFSDDCDCCHEDFEDEIFEVECPNCHETVFFDESILDDEEELRCPACGTIFEDIVFEEEETNE